MANEKYCVYKHTCPTSKQTKTDYCNILKCLKHKKYCHTAGGYHWEYAGEVV